VGDLGICSDHRVDRLGATLIRRTGEELINLAA
jgi:hypothetical protein